MSEGETERDVPGRGCYGNRYSFECLKEKMCSVEAVMERYSFEFLKEKMCSVKDNEQKQEEEEEEKEQEEETEDVK